MVATRRSALEQLCQFEAGRRAEPAQTNAKEASKRVAWRLRFELHPAHRTVRLLGAQASSEQLDKIISYLQLGRREGAKVLIGGEQNKLDGDLGDRWQLAADAAGDATIILRIGDRPVSPMQLDLFEHSRDVALRNALVQALLRRDTSAAGAARDALAAEYPDDRVLVDASTLIDLLPQIGIGSTHAAMRKAHDQIEQQVTPAAMRLFGDIAARAWLQGPWAQLARSALKLPYSRDDPQCHAAALWLRAGEWDAVVAAVESIESWRRIPVPLAWMAQARWQLSGLDLALPLLVELAWISPARFDQLARSLEDRALRALLKRFDADFEGNGDREDAAWFPAWVLTDEPRLSDLFAACRTSRGSDAERGWELMMAVLKLEHQGRHADLIEHRKRLKGLHEGLYRSYMKSR